jgi:HEAT repeats
MIACCTLMAAAGAHAQQLRIGIIDFYGLGHVSVADVRHALTFKEGDTVAIDGGRPAVLGESEKRLSTLPRVAQATITLVCCDAGSAIVFVGIQQEGAQVLRFRPAPTGAARLTADVVEAGNRFSTAFMAAVQRGDAGEDDSHGHALAHDPATRRVQELFIGYAARDLPLLREVLRESGDTAHRALAAQVLGYAADKQSVVGDLVQAMTDPSEDVRNNAMRTLMVFAASSPGHGGQALRVPHAPFVSLLNSPVWSDRNKASGALLALSADRHPELIARLSTDAIRPLAEMARWKSAGHAFAPFMILGRIAGYPDDVTQAAWDRGEREGIIRAAVDRQ